MERVAALGQRTFRAEEWICDHEAFDLTYSSHLQQAKGDVTACGELGSQSARRETVALYETGAALREAFFGNAPAAR